LSHHLDPFIPSPDIRERHTTVVRAPASLVFDTARAFDMQSVPLIRAIIGLRQLLLDSTRIERRPQPFLQEALGMGWVLLASDPGRAIVMGAACQPWLADVQFQPIPSTDFAAYREPNRVKIAWTLEAESLGAASARLATETREVATDGEAGRRFRRYWRWARVGIVAIRWVMLSEIRRQAERAWRAQSRPPGASAGR
jgi:hypothetical protein